MAKPTETRVHSSQYDEEEEEELEQEDDEQEQEPGGETSNLEGRDDEDDEAEFNDAESIQLGTYGAQTEQFNEEEDVYSNPSSSELGNKMRETQNRDRIRELIDARSKRDTALYNIQDRLARAGPVIYALTQCETGTRVELEVKIVNKDLISLSKDWVEAEDFMYKLVKGYEET